MRLGTIALAAALVVTATVTLARAQLAGVYQVVITNRETGHNAVWTRKSFPDQNRCDEAIRGVTESLNSIAAMKFVDGRVVGELVPAPNEHREVSQPGYFLRACG